MRQTTWFLSREFNVRLKWGCCVVKEMRLTGTNSDFLLCSCHFVSPTFFWLTQKIWEVAEDKWGWLAWSALPRSDDKSLEVCKTLSGLEFVTKIIVVILIITINIITIIIITIDIIVIVVTVEGRRPWTWGIFRLGLVDALRDGENSDSLLFNSKRWCSGRPFREQAINTMTNCYRFHWTPEILAKLNNIIPCLYFILKQMESDLVVGRVVACWWLQTAISCNAEVRLH